MGRLPRPRRTCRSRRCGRSPRSSARSRTSSHDEPGLAGARVLSGLDTLLRIVDQRVENLRVPILLVVFQIGAVTLAVLAGVAALTLTRQAFELSVLHSRGFSRRTLLLAQGVQAVARRAGGVPARPADRPGPGEPRRPHERSVAPRRAVPRAAEPVRRGAGRARGRDRRAHPAAALAPVHLADRAGGTTGLVAGGSPAAVPRARRADRAAGRHLRVHPAPGRHEAEARRGHDRPAGAAGPDAAAVRRLVPGAATAAVRLPSDGPPDRTVEARCRSTWPGAS